MPIKLAVLVSGRGSNLEAILKAIANGELDAQVQLVLSNRAQVAALEIARRYGVDVFAVESKGLSRREHEQCLLQYIDKYKIDFVVLAGYMRVLTRHFLQHFQDPAGYYKVINIHPSLLPSFPGRSAYEDAFAYGVRVSGVTVHLLDDLVDHGPILAQESYLRLESDTLETFQARGLAIEHVLYPAVLQSISRQGIRLLPKTRHIEKAEAVAAASGSCETVRIRRGAKECQ